MAVTLIIEDGTGVANANSFVTIDEYKAFAANRGIQLPSGDDPIAIQLIKAVDAINMYSNLIAGQMVKPEQAMIFPRSGVPVPGYPDYVYEDYTIPPALKEAQMQFAVAINSGIDLFPTISGKFIKRRKVGPIETEYSEAVQADGRVSVPGAYNSLSLLFAFRGFNLRTQRV